MVGSFILISSSISRYFTKLCKPENKKIILGSNSRYGDFIVREAKLSDKDGVLNIRKNMYDGLDFLPDMYDHMVSAPSGKAFLAHQGDEIVSRRL